MNRILVTSVLAALFAAPALAQPPAKDAPAKKDAPKHEAQPNKDAQAMQEAWMKAGQPGANHKLLSQMEGEWTAETTEMMPGAPEAKSKGTMRSKVVLDGRFLHMEYDGKAHGQPYRGAGTMGYNNTDKRFESTWSDSMGTATSFMTGTADAAGKVFTMTGEHTNPASGKKETAKEVITITDSGHYTMDFFMSMDGKDVKVMTIAFTRGKGGKEGKHDNHSDSHDDKGKGKDKSK